MTPEQTELSRQLVANPKMPWPWPNGVNLIGRSQGRPCRCYGEEAGAILVVWPDRTTGFACQKTALLSFVLDLCDDAAGGVLLRMVRASWPGPLSVSYGGDRDSRVWVGLVSFDVAECVGSTLAEACARALLTH